MKVSELIRQLQQIDDDILGEPHNDNVRFFDSEQGVYHTVTNVEVVWSSDKLGVDGEVFVGLS